MQDAVIQSGNDGDATLVGLGNCLGVDPRWAFVSQANLGLGDAIPLGLGAGDVGR